MIKLTTAEAVQKAIEKAREAKPLARGVDFGSYAVTNKQTGASYTVTCRKQGGEKFAACTCKAGARGQKCYHVVAAVGAHIQIAAGRAAPSA